MATAFIEREDDRFETETASSASDGLTRLADSALDCVISDYDMPRQNGLEFLRTVREEYPELPFILHTGKGSDTVGYNYVKIFGTPGCRNPSRDYSRQYEEAASDAISAGATDYIQKESGTDHFSVLAKRVKTAVERTRAERQRQQLAEAIETAREGIGIIGSDGHHTAVNRAYADAYGSRPSELVGIIPGERG
nr:response regulator [Halobellus ruber]